jgi:hypothetical protein
MRPRASALVALLVQTVASGGAPAKARGLVIRAVVVDAGTDKPIASARVTLCGGMVEPAGVVVNREVRACDHELEVRETRRNGETAVRWEGATADLARAGLLVHADRYLQGFVSGSELSKRVGATGRLRIALTAGARISGVVTRPDGSAVADVQFGWVTEEGRALRVRRVSYYNARNGEVASADEELAPVGEVTVFAVVLEPSPRLAVARVVTEPGRETRVALEVRQPLLRVRGKVVTADGAPLTANVSAEPADPAAPAIERALMSIGDRRVALGDGPTTPPGEFAVLAVPGARLRLRASTWIPGGGHLSDHVGTRPLAELSVDLASHDSATPLLLKAPASPVVTCTFADPKGTTLLIDGLDLSFGPHLHWGHSGGCVATPRLADVPPAPTERVSFIWPDGADAVSVVVYSDTLQGRVRLKRPDEPCHIQPR